MRTSSSILIVLTAAAFFGAVPSAHAQQIPDNVITGGAGSADAQAAIRALVDANKAGLAGDTAAIKRSRSALLQPLRTAGISPEFRSNFGSALKPVLEPLIKDKRDEVAVSALSIAGDLGTRDGMELLTRGLSDERPQVRVRAALGFARTFVTCREGTPALIPSQADNALKTLGDATGKERDAHVLDALAAAFESAMRVPDQQVEGLRAKAADALASAISTVVRRDGSGSGTLAAQSRATRALFEMLRDRSNNVPAPLAVQAAGLGGDVLVAAAKRTDAGGLSENDRAQLSLVVTQAERVIITAGERLGASVSESKLGDMLSKSEDERFRAEVAKVVAVEGVLCKPPIALPADRFSK